MIGSDRGQARILSRPFGIEWAGWRSDTHRLQRSGWELAVECEMCWREYRLLMRHRMLKLYAVTHMEKIDDIERITSPYMRCEDMPIFKVIGVAPQIRVVEMQQYGPMSFKQFDAEPCMTTAPIRSIEDMNIFNVPMTRTEEVMIDKADMTVIEHLEAIKRLQSDKQREIRQRIVTSDSAGFTGGYEVKPRMHMVAQLVHYAEAA